MFRKKKKILMPLIEGISLEKIQSLNKPSSLLYQVREKKTIISALLIV